MDEVHNEYSIEIANLLRNENIISEVYFEDAKIGKKLDYANKLGIPYVILIGGNELASKKPALKDMRSGNQNNLNLDEIIGILKQNI